MTETRRHRIELGGWLVHAIDEGPEDAPCVLLSHSIMTNLHMWDGQVPGLLALGFRVLRYDSRGHGESSAPQSPCTMRELADDVVALLDRLSVARCHFVGLSLGGIVGFDLASRHRERLLSLVVADARADASPDFVAPWNERIATARTHGMQALVEPTMSRWFGTQLQTRAPETAQAIRAMIANTQVAGFVAIADALQHFDCRSAVKALPIPTTLLAGERDGVLPAVMSELATDMQCTIEIIASAGHLPNVEQGAAFDAALQRHFARAGALQGRQRLQA